MADEYREYAELPGLLPREAETLDGYVDSTVPTEPERFGEVEHLPPIPVDDDPPRERQIVDRKGRVWEVTEVEEPDGVETVTLRFRHGAIEVLAQQAEAGWGRLPSSKLLSFAGLD
ncbi:MAG TPA: hypothetical protein VKZ41_12340 [Gemmatimonadales bacterium]|nr:hypothetical protein [Gemmatimonadales bacterium]